MARGQRLNCSTAVVARRKFVGIPSFTQGLRTERMYCLETVDQRQAFQTRPDILIKRGDAVVQVIDTKWKRIATRIDDPRRGVSQADVYQMMAYGRLYQCNRLTLLYPHHSEAGCAEGLISNYTVNSGLECLELFSVDVASGEDIKLRLAGVCSTDVETRAW